MADVATVSAEKWDTWKHDCSGFVRAVTTELGVPLTGTANQMVDNLSAPGNGWIKLGNDPQKAQEYANRGFLVIAGLKASGHGHVVIIVSTAQPQKYPVGYWGQYGGTGRENTTINWSWNHADLPKVQYFVRQLP